MTPETDGGSSDPPAEGSETGAATDGPSTGTGDDPTASARSGGGTDPDPAGDPRLGRRILLGVGATVVVLSAGIGWLVGSQGALDAAAVLGTGIAIPVTPAAIALYGAVVSTAILGGLFGLVELASRLEGDRTGRE